MLFVLSLHTDDGAAYSVVAPDLPGCFSAGATLDNAIEIAREAIDAYCELLAEDGVDVALRQPLAVHRANPELAGTVCAVVDVPVGCYFGLAEKINIAVPARMAMFQFTPSWALRAFVCLVHRLLLGGSPAACRDHVSAQAV